MPSKRPCLAALALLSWATPLWAQDNPRGADPGIQRIESSLRQVISGDKALEYFEKVVRDVAGDDAWEANRERISAQFTDLGLRPKVAGMLRGGRPITHAVDLGARGGVCSIRISLQEKEIDRPSNVQIAVCVGDDPLAVGH